MAFLWLSVHPPIRLSAQDTLPIGFGTLRRDDVAIRFATDEVELQVLPLEQDVIRLLAPDTYRSLTALLTSRQTDIAIAAARAGLRTPTLVVVTFFGIVPQARFSPDELEITSRGKPFRPLGIVPLSPTWATLQLDARQQTVAIYLFEEGISFREPVTIRYQGLTNDAWGRSVTMLERERARVLARARAQRSP